MGENIGLKDGKTKNIERLLRVPTELGSIDTDKEDSIRNIGPRITGCISKSRHLAFHTTTSGLEGI